MNKTKKGWDFEFGNLWKHNNYTFQFELFSIWYNSDGWKTLYLTVFNFQFRWENFKEQC